MYPRRALHTREGRYIGRRYVPAKGATIPPFGGLMLLSVRDRRGQKSKVKGSKKQGPTGQGSPRTGTGPGVKKTGLTGVKKTGPGVKKTR